jgi:hypothetical protein
MIALQADNSRHSRGVASYIRAVQTVFIATIGLTGQLPGLPRRFRTRCIIPKPNGLWPEPDIYDDDTPV